MGRGDEEVLDVVLVLHVHPHHADPAAALLAVRGHREPLDVARARDRDDHVLLGDHVLELERVLAVHDLRAAIVALAVDLLDLEQLLADQRVDPGGVAEDRAELRDPLLQVAELVLDPLALEPRERAEPEVEDRLRLLLRELEARHQRGARLVGVVRGADQRDHLVEVVERDQVALQDVGALLGLPQLVLRPPRDDLALVVEVVPDELEERERAWHPVDERDGVVAERRLQRRVLEELVERDLRDRVALELDLDPHAALVGVVGEVRDLRDHLVVDEVGDLLDHAGVAALLDPVRELGDHDRALPAAELLDVRPRAHHDAAAPGSVGVADPRPADDDRAGGEVGPVHVLHQVVDARVGLVDQLHDRVDRLAELVRRDVRRHPHRDPRRAVDEQVREAGRQHRRLAARLVVVRDEVDRVHVDVAQHLRRESRQPALRVPHRRGGSSSSEPKLPCPSTSG